MPGYIVHHLFTGSLFSTIRNAKYEFTEERWRHLALGFTAVIPVLHGERISILMDILQHYIMSGYGQFDLVQLFCEVSGYSGTTQPRHHKSVY